MCNSSEPAADSAKQAAADDMSNSLTVESSTSSGGSNMNIDPSSHTTSSTTVAMDDSNTKYNQRTTASVRQQAHGDFALGTGNNVVLSPKKSVQHSNIFRIGDFCYFETNTKAPYSIRKIEEITKVKDVPEPYVEVKATIFKRRCEVPEQSLQQFREQGFDDFGPEDADLFVSGESDDILSHDDHVVTDVEAGENAAVHVAAAGRTTRLRARHSRRYSRVEMLQQRQLFNTRVTESLPAMYIRGKCYVDTLLGGSVDRCDRYFEYSDTFFYSNCYDPDDHEVYKRKRGDIRIGSAFQADVRSSVASINSSAGAAESCPEPDVFIAFMADQSETSKEPATDNETATVKHAAVSSYGLRQRGQKRALLDAAGGVKRSGTASVKLDEAVDSPKLNVGMSDSMDISANAVYEKISDDSDKLDVKDALVDEPSSTAPITSTSTAAVKPTFYDVLVWSPSRLPPQLDDTSVKSFVTAAKAIGLYSRALELTGGVSMRQPSVHITTALANRDATTQYAYDTLHAAHYDVSSALCALNSEENGLIVCRDQFEAWSSSEACLFEEGLARHGKNFGAMRKEYLPWKRVSHIVDYYYAWKTTDRYQQARRFKTSRAVQHMRQFSMHKVAVEDSKQPHRQQVGQTPFGTTTTADGAATHKCFVCDKLLTDYFYHFGPALATSSSGAGGVGGGSGAAGAAASAAAAAMYSSSTAAQMTRICYDCQLGSMTRQLYWRRYACLRRPFVNDQERRIVNDFVNLPHERSVQQAAAQALSNYQQNVNVSQNTAVQLTAQKLLQQQQQQQFGTAAGSAPLSSASTNVAAATASYLSSTLTTKSATVPQQQQHQQLSTGTAANTLFGLGTVAAADTNLQQLQPPPFMHGKPPMIVGGGLPGVAVSSHNSQRLSSSLTTAVGVSPAVVSAHLQHAATQSMISGSMQHSIAGNSNIAVNNINPPASVSILNGSANIMTSSNPSGAPISSSAVMGQSATPTSGIAVRNSVIPFTGNNENFPLTSTLRAAGISPVDAVASNNIALYHTTLLPETTGGTLLHASPPAYTESPTKIRSTVRADNEMQQLQLDIGDGDVVMSENLAASGSAASTSVAGSTSSLTLSQAAAAQHRNNLRSRVSIFLLMTPASRAMRRLFEQRIDIVNTLARDPCNAGLTSSPTMPTIYDMRTVAADGHALARVLNGNGRNRFRERKSINDIIRCAGISDLPHPRWLLPLSGSELAAMTGSSYGSALQQQRLRFLPSDHKIIDPKQVIMQHMNLLSSSSSQAAAPPAGGNNINVTAGANGSAVVDSSGNLAGSSTSNNAGFPVKSDMSLASSVTTPSSSPLAAQTMAAGILGNSRLKQHFGGSDRQSANSSKPLDVGSKSHANTSHNYTHQRADQQQQHRLIPGTALEDFAWVCSRSFSRKKLVDAARLAGIVLLGSGEMTGEQRAIAKSLLRKAGRNPVRVMGWPELAAK